MTEDAESMVRVDPERSKAFVRGLVPRAAIETVCVAIGVAAYFATGQIFWLPVAVVAGSLPVLFYILKYARENRAGAAMTAQPGARVVRNIVE
jgi:hypothetical protein